MQLTSITANVIFTIALIIITCLLTMLSKKIKVAYPILLVVAGLLLSFAPHTPFPQRSLIIYITFIVILVTLLLQGLTLPYIIKHTVFPDFHDHIPVRDTERLIRNGLAKESLSYLKENNTCRDVHQGKLLHTMVEHWQQQLSFNPSSQQNDDDSKNIETEASPLYGEAAQVYYNILEQQRLYLYRLNKEREDIDENIIRRFIHRIDLEEERIKSD